MGLFTRRPRTRADIVAAADRARARGRVRKAVAGYRLALEADPADPGVNVKLAPLLARLGDAEGGARCFHTAAQRHAAAGFTDRAAAVYLAAAGVFPLEPEFRLELARLNVARGRQQDALAALLDGGKAQARSGQDEAASALLSRALELEPWHLEIGLALAPVLARSGRAEGARVLVDGLLQRHGAGAARRIRWVAFRLWPGPGTFWRWLRA